LSVLELEDKRKEKLLGVIYEAVNTVNNKRYIGKTNIDMEFRKRNHIKESLKPNPKTLFHRSLKKYGENSFCWNVIETCEDYILPQREIFYISKFRTYIGFDDCNGYNMTLGGDGGDMLSNHPDKLNISKKISESNKGSNHYLRKLSNDERLTFLNSHCYGEKNVMYGKIHTNETKEKMSKAHSLTSNGFYGKKHIQETKELMSKKAQGRGLGEKNNMFGKKGIDNHFTKRYVITLPLTGERFVIIGYSDFIEWYKKEKSIILYVQLLGRVAKGLNKHHKGIICEYYDAKIHSNLQIKELK
jgi:group I intron endonuclease